MLAFSLAEIIAVVGLMGTGVGVGTVVVSKVNSSAMDAKLGKDLLQVNSAIRIYLTGGGTLQGLTDPQAVVDKLKTVVTTENRNDREVMFAKRSMIDQRLTVVRDASSAERGFWRWSRLTARYNPAALRFELAPPGASDAILGFALNDAAGTTLSIVESRTVVFRQAKNDPWVWDFDPSSAAASGTPPGSFEGAHVYGSVGAPAALNGAVRAQPPLFNPEPPKNLLNDYPLSVSLTNPNNQGISRILYHLDPGPGIDVPYSGSLTVNPGDKVVAFVQSLDTTIYLDSEVAQRTYTPDPVQPQLNDTFPATYTYLELGGPLAAGSPTSPAATPGLISLTNGDQIPNLYENASHFRIYWTSDGTNPATSGSAVEGRSFFEGYPGDSVPVVLDAFGSSDQVTIQYYARSHRAVTIADSTVVSRNIGISKLSLPPPVLSTPAGATITSGPVSMYADVSTGVVPVDTRIFYRIDGQDPGDLGGEPGPGALLYTAPVPDVQDGNIVTARLYPPSARKNWFNASPASPLQIGTALASLYYAVGDNDRKIYVFDPNGTNVVKTTSALFPIECIAADATNTKVYYIENATSSWRLGMYDVQTGSHLDLGKLDQDFYVDRPVSQPTNLMYFNDGLYYIHENTDNLVKIELNGDNVAQQFRVADITGDSIAFVGIGDIVADANGRMVISATNAFATFDLRKMADYTEVATNPSQVWSGLVFGGGNLLGVKSSSPATLYAVSLTDGNGSSPVNFSPVRNFSDFAGPQPRVLTEPVGGQHFFVTNGQSNILRLDLSTGRNYLVTTLLPMQPTGIAIDRTNSYLYTVGFDDSGRPGDAFLVRFNLTTGEITDLGSLKDGSLSYRPASYPVCLTYFQGGLYYVPTDTDDLVKIEFGDSSITSQAKEADILDNQGDLGDVDALTIGPDGWLYLSRSDGDLLAKYEIAALGNFTILKNIYEADYQALTYDIYGQLHGTFASKPRQVFITDETNGNSEYKFDTQPNLAIYDITGMFDTTPPPITNDYFATDGSTNRIYRVDPDTGWNQVYATTPWVPDTIAFDTDRRRVYYLKKDLYDLAVYDIASQTHTVLGTINNALFNYIPSARPYNLTCFNGSLYYITPNTDDLVKVEIDPFGRLGQAYKVADLTGNASNLNLVGDTAVDANGMLYLSSSTVFSRFDMRTLSGYQQLALTPEHRFAGLLFTVDGRLKGTRVEEQRLIHSIDLATGYSTGWIPNIPYRAFGDLAGPQNRVPVEVAQGVYYFAQPSSSTIRELNSDTGGNRILTWAAPWNIGGIAHDPEAKVIYYSENPGGTPETHLGKYEIELDRHTELGSLSAAGLGYVPSAMPKHLVFFLGDLYYIAPNTDDLVQVIIDDRQIVSADKVADINANTSLADIGAVAVDGAGWLYMAKQSGNLLAKFNLYTRNRYSSITTASGSSYAGLTFDPANLLHGFPVTDPAKVYTINSSGVKTLKVATSPSQEIWDITGNNSCPPPDIPGNYYGVGGGNRRIYKFDPVTGITGVMTNTAPFNLRALARDPDTNILYYIEDVSNNFRLGKYTLATNLHAVLGNLQAPGYLYTPTVRPPNLFLYGGAIFYLARQSDDLIMITVDGSQITSQVKVADVTGNARSFDQVGDIAVDATGRAYASASDGTFFSFSMKTLGGYSSLSSAAPHYYAMLFTDAGALYGVHGGQATAVQSISRSNGAPTFSAATLPGVSFWDMAGHEVSAPWEKGDSLWAIVKESTGNTAAWSYGFTPASPNAAVTSGAAAAWKNVTFNYDGNTRVLSGRVTVDHSVINGSTGATQWKAVSFVLGSGATPTPSSSSPTHAWMILDYSAGQPRLGVYRYDTSYESSKSNPTTILNANQTEGGLTVSDQGTLRTFEFSLDIGPIQQAYTGSSWKGAEMAAAIGSSLRAWAQPTISYGTNQQITNWVPGQQGTGAGANNAGLTLNNVATGTLTGRLVEFKNYRTPAIQAADWGLIYYRDGGSLVPLSDTTGIEAMAISSSGLGFFVKNGAAVIGGISYQKPLFKIDMAAQSTGRAVTATFVGDLQRGLTKIGAAASDPVTGLAMSPGGLLYGTLRMGDASLPDRLFTVANLLKDSSGQFTTVASVGLLEGNGQSASATEDLSFSANGALYVSDVADGHLYTVDPATAALQSLVSARANVSYRGLAINPADGDITVSDTSSDSVLHVQGAASADAPYFQYNDRFQFTDIRAIAFLNGTFLPTETTPPYYAINRTQRIYAVDPASGATTLLTADAPFAMDSIAYDQAGGKLYYTEFDDGSIRLGRYMPSTDTHTILGNLTTGGFSYAPTRDIQNLVFFAGDLYYVHVNSDDLVRVRVSAGAIVSQEKVADLNGNVSLGMVSGAALNDAGMLFLCNPTSLFKFNLRANSGFTTVTSSFGSYESLLWNSAASRLNAAPSAAVTRIDAVATTSGVATTGPVTTPPVSLYDLSGPNSAVPLSGLASSLFAVTGGNKTLYVLDPLTGLNSVIDSTAPFNLRAIALDSDNGLLYYTEDTTDTTTFRLGVYNLNTGIHVIIGNLRGTGSYAYTPGESPGNLAFYGGALHYVPKNSDDLIRVAVSGSTIQSQAKLLDMRANTPFTEIGDLAVSLGGLMYFGARATGSPVYRFDLSTLTGLQSFGSATRFYDATAIFNGNLYGSAAGVTNVDGWTTGTTSIVSAGSVASNPLRAFVDFAGPAPSSATGRSSSMWAIVETPAGHLVEIRNPRNAQIVEAIDHGDIFYQDGATVWNLTENAVKIAGLTITNNGLAFFVQNARIASGGQSYDRPLFSINLASLALGSPVMATFVGDLREGLSSSQALNASDRITGLGIGPDGALYGVLNLNNNQDEDRLFRVTSLRVSSGKNLVDVTTIGPINGAGFVSVSGEDMVFDPSGDLHVADDTSDHVLQLSLSTAQVTQSYSYEANVQYLALAADPSDGALIASRVSGAEEKVFVVVTPGTIPDNVLWDYNTRFDWTRTEAMAFYSKPFTGAEGALYAVGATGKSIHTISPLNGMVTQLDADSPTPGGSIVSLAYSAPRHTLYYVDAPDASSHFRLYSYNIPTDAHTLLGQLDSGNFAYPITESPGNLACINGELFFIHKNTDDLVRITLDGTSIASVQKIADLSNDVQSLGEVGDLSVREDGVLFFSANAKLWRYDLNTLTGLQQVAATSQDYKALTFSNGNLVGNRTAAVTSLYLVNSSDGTDSVISSTSPALDVADLASIEPDVTLPAVVAAPYYGINRTRTIYTVDPVSAVTTVLTAGAAFDLDAIAHHKAGNVLYYLENNDATIRLGKYDIGSNAHTILGDLKSSSFAYTPVQHPEHLACYDGDLYYVAVETDDLIKVKVSGSGIISQQRVVDLNGDLSLGLVRAATVDEAGVFYFTYASSLAKYDLRTGGNVTSVSSSVPAYDGLLWYSTQSRLAGASAASPSRIDAVSTVTGAVTVGAVSAPAVSFVDLAGGNTAPASASALFYGVNRSTAIYRLDPLTGITSALPTAASYSLEALAYDQARRQLYVVENTNTNTRLGRYDLTNNTFASLGNLRASGWAFVPTERPQHLAFFAGDLYYVNYDANTSALRDDLIRIRVSDTAILGQEKVVDINANTALNRVTAATVADSGMLYVAAAADLKAFDLRSLNGLTTISKNNSPVWSGLLWSQTDGFLYGTNSSTASSRNQVTKINAADGKTSYQADAAPQVTNGFYDLASGNNAPPHPSLDVPRAYIGGEFSNGSGGYVNVARLNNDGTLDTTFNPGTGANAAVRALSRQPNGQLIVAGEFTQFNGQSRKALARLNPDGSLDAGFVPQLMAAGSFSELTTDLANWTTFSQNAALSGADTWTGSRNAYYGLSGASGGVAGFASQTWNNVSGSGVNMTLYYSQNMTEAGGARDGLSDGPDLYGDTVAYTGGVNPDRRITGHTALRLNSDRSGTITPVTVVASFSEPVYLNQAVWGSLSQIGGATTTFGANLAPNGSFESGPGWAGGPDWFPNSTHANRARSRRNQVGSGVVDYWSIDGFDWVEGATRSTDGSYFVYLTPSDQSWNHSIGQDIGVGASSTPSTPLIRSRNYRITYNAVTFNPNFPDGQNASAAAPAIEFTYRDASNSQQYGELYNLQDTTTGLPPGDIPATNWTAPQWRTISAYFTAPVTHATNNKLTLWISEVKREGSIKSDNFMGDYNVIVFDDLNASSDVDGKTWVGGNLTGTASFQLGDQYTAGTNEKVVVVGGTINGTASTAAINFNGGTNAKLAVKDLASRGSRPINWNGGGSQATRLVLDPLITASFGTMKGDLLTRSQVYKTLTANSTMSTPSDQSDARQFICTPGTFANQSGVSVFTIDASALFGDSGVAQVDISSSTGNPDDVTGVIINVSGTSVNWTSAFNFAGGFTSNTWRQKVIWNFHEATSLACGSHPMSGAVLAPLAAVTSAGNFDGSLVCKSLSTTAECHRVPFTSQSVTNIGLNMTSSGMLIDNVKIQEVTTSTGYFENAYFRAFSTPDATGTPLAADSYSNLSLQSTPLLGTSFDPITANFDGNVRMDPVISDNVYQTIGMGRQEENRYGRVSFSYTGQPVRSVALSLWTTAATENISGQIMPKLDGALTANPSASTFSLLGFTRASPPLGKVYAIAQEPGGKVMIGGDFGQVNGVATKNVARLNSDGTLDPTFNPGQGPNAPVLSLAVQSDGSTLAGGSFSSWNGQSSGNRLVRLTPAGARDTAFAPGFSTGTSDAVNWLAVDASNRVMAGGRFTTPGNGITRLTAAGVVDSSFSAGSGTGSTSVNAGVVLPDGKVIIGGDFTTVNGAGRNRVARLDADGTVDTAWSPGTGFDGLVQAVALLHGSEYLHAGGSFSLFQGNTRNKVAPVGTVSADAGRSPWGPSTLTITRIWSIQ